MRGGLSSSGRAEVRGVQAVGIMSTALLCCKTIDQHNGAAFLLPEETVSIRKIKREPLPRRRELLGRKESHPGATPEKIDHTCTVCMA